MDEEAGVDALAELPELVEGVEAELPEEPAVSEELLDARSPELPEVLPVVLPEELPEVPPAALSAAVTAGAGSLVLEPPLSPPPLLRKSVTYQPEPLS